MLCGKRQRSDGDPNGSDICQEDIGADDQQADYNTADG